MNNYKANEIERMAQRFVTPIWIKDELGGISFSSTMTFLKYKGIYFCVFAAHAIPTNKMGKIESLGFLSTDGKFTSFSDSNVFENHEIFEKDDIVVCSTKGAFELKNYFDLDNHCNSFNINKKINWIGFPAKKAKNYHKTKSSESHIKKELSVLEDGVKKWENAKFLWIENRKMKENDNVHISAHFDNKKVSYKYEGYKESGYSLNGMSGGALFFFDDKNEMFEFAGIGLRWDGKLIKGIPKKLIMKILDKFIENHNTFDISLSLIV